MEEIRGVRIRIDVDTNKKTVTEIVYETNLSAAASETSRRLARIEKDLHADN